MWRVAMTLILWYTLWYFDDLTIEINIWNKNIMKNEKKNLQIFRWKEKLKHKTNKKNQKQNNFNLTMQALR